MKNILSLAIISFLIFNLSATALPDSTNTEKQNIWSIHFQNTVITQVHLPFNALYSGQNSLSDTLEPPATSLTATLFIGRKLWNNGAFYFNPEVSGGKGLSYATGVAGALNGETYRVGADAPSIFIARAYYQHEFPLSNTLRDTVADGINQLATVRAKNRFVIFAGKFAVADFFDNNTYSKDPRTQFFNWSIWANGAWDYPANTRGYDYGLVAALEKPNWAIRFASVAVPRIANSHYMEYNFKARSTILEYEQHYRLNNQPGALRILICKNLSQAPSYAQGIRAIGVNDTHVLEAIRGDVENKRYEGHKLTLGLNAEQQINNNIGAFARLGWNDGQYASWAFTEIDKTFCTGVSILGNSWHRPNDVVGLAGVVNGISKSHQNFLKAGGYGFIIGDGTLNYSPESILELYYNIKLANFFELTLDYQFVNNPGYNKDRGPVNAFAARGHIYL